MMGNRTKPMVRLAVMALTLSLVACSQPGGDGGAQEDVSEMSSPDIAPTAAPGVAFSYRYDFRLADARISAIQEAHAAQCETLGVARCRITGLTYRIDDDDQVSAMLQVKLDPMIARRFGKESVAGVEKHGGRLVNAEFSGEDEGAAIRSVSAQKSDLEIRIADIERRLAGLRAGDRERTQLQQQLEQLRGEAAEARQRISASEERLANTPMTFNYYGKGGIPGFRGENPVAEAWRLFVASAVTMITVLLRVIGAILPWALLALLLALAYRSRAGQKVRRWVRGSVDQPAEEQQ